jgi:hypothetical protein
VEQALMRFGEIER